MKDDPRLALRQPRRMTLIGCPAVLAEVAPEEAASVPCRPLEAGLHLHPHSLRDALASEVAQADVPGVTIVLACGLCSAAVVGLRTRHATLVVPKVDDCIAMFLGGNEAYDADRAQAPGTYYVAGAYLEECATIFSDYEALVEKRGVAQTDRMMRLMLSGYTRIAVIDMERRPLGDSEAKVIRFAERFGLTIERLPGTARIVDALVAGEWGDDFVVAPPGHALTLEDFRPEYRVPARDPAGL